jgi:hypothetical protein
MEIEYYKLAVVAFWPILATMKVIYDTRGVCFFSPGNTTDNEKMLKAATEVKFFDWPSKMHSLKYGRGQTREYYVLALKLLQFFYKNKISDHVNFTLALIANCISAILIYFVMSNYFNSNVGLIVSLLYSTCIWNYQIILIIGHVHLAQMLMFFAILSIQMVAVLGDNYAFYCYFLGGVFTVSSFVSSSSSRKYPILAFIAFIYSLHEYITFPWEGNYFSVTNSSILLAIVSLIIFYGFIANVSQKIILKIVNKITKKEYTYNSGSSLGILLKMILTSIIGFLFIKTLFPDFAVVQTYFLAYCLGASVVTFHILGPISEFKENVVRYLAWLMGTWRSHFNVYSDQERVFGKKLPDGFRGEGFPWVYRMFWRVIPIVYILYVLSVAVVFFNIFNHFGFDHVFLAGSYFIGVIVISLLPVLMSELTSSLQVGKAYYPSFIGFLFLIGMALDIIFEVVKGNDQLLTVVYTITVIVILVQLSLSLYSYFKDVLPARMAAASLRNNLRKMNIKEFYTYDNLYNISFVKTMISSYPNEFDIKYVDNIKEVKDGIIVIPGISSKSLCLEGWGESRDFSDDETLNELYKNKDIESLAMFKIKTVGCSRLFALESEVTGYRDLILKQISDHDRWLGNAWVLSAKTVAEFVDSKQ